MRVRRTILIAVTALAALPAVAQAQVQVQIDPGLIAKRIATAPPAVVALGDSAISGEAGRWAGNTNQASSKTDALGSGAYNDAGSAEATPGCHRSKSAEVHIGDGIESKNLACSGARTYTRTSDGKFKPGIDFYSNGANKGQALALKEYAATRNVKTVVVLIGANDYGFAEIVETCVINWLTSPSWWKNYCQDDSNMVQMFSAANITKVTADVKQAFLNVKSAMSQAGYSDSQYEIIAQTYSAPLPTSSGFRYPETGFTRQTIGGCGVWNSDANWARNTVVNTLNTTIKNATAGMANVKLLEWSTPSTAASCARTPSGCSRRRASRPGRAPAPWTKPSGCTRSARHDDLPALPAAGGRTPELLGPDGAAQLLPPGPRPRRGPSRHELRSRNRPQRQGRAEHGRVVGFADRAPARRHRRSSRRRPGGRAGACRRAARRLADAARLRRRLVRRARAAAGPPAPARAADRDLLPLVPGRRPCGRAHAGGRRGRPGLPVDRQQVGVPRDLRAAAATAQPAAGRQPRHRPLRADRLQERAVVHRAHVRERVRPPRGALRAGDRRALRPRRVRPVRHRLRGRRPGRGHPRARLEHDRPLRRLLRHAGSRRTSSPATRGRCTRSCSTRPTRGATSTRGTRRRARPRATALETVSPGSVARLGELLARVRGTPLTGRTRDADGSPLECAWTRARWSTSSRTRRRTR